MDAMDLRKQADHIVMHLVNTGRNRGLLKTVPHKDVLDLSIIYRMVVDRGNGGLRTILITNAVSEKLGLSQNEISLLAYRNTVRMFPLELFKCSDRLYMMTNSAKLHGAAVMVYKGAIKKLSQRLGGNLFIIPSSVHEVMVVSETSVDLGFLLQALSENNRSHIEKQEVLSDHVYCYDQKRNVIGIASSSARPFRTELKGGANVGFFRPAPAGSLADTQCGPVTASVLKTPPCGPSPAGGLNASPFERSSAAVSSAPPFKAAFPGVSNMPLFAAPPASGSKKLDKTGKAL